MSDLCPPCNCDDTQEVVALKQRAADLKAKILARQSELTGQINSLKAELADLQQKNTEYLRPKSDVCPGSAAPQSLNAIKTYRFASKCG